MSGHSKWNNIKRKKEKTDGQKAKIFTKMGREIAVAVKEGGPDPASNGKLRDCIAKAKAANVPNDNIERVIKKAASEGDKNNFEKRKQVLSSIVENLNKKYHNCIELDIKDSYRNMFEIINKETSLVEETKSAINNLGITPQIIPIRGGTDGTNISFLGIPCPNLGTGGHNFHSIYEYICLDDMAKTSEILISIIKQFSQTKCRKKTK